MNIDLKSVGCGIVIARMGSAGVLLQLNPIAAADAARLDHPAQQAAPATNFFLQAGTDFIHLVARSAGLRDLKQNFADSQPLGQRQFLEQDSARGDVFPDAPRYDAELLQRFDVHDQNLAGTPGASVNAVLEALILDGGHFLEFAHGLAVRQALK
jgi:hypothetical protein